MDQHVKTLAHLFLDGEEDKALHFTEELLNEYSLMSFYEAIITPAMYYIGELWETNQISVADEHLATAICDFVISQIKGKETVRSGNDQSSGRALFFGMEEEQHYIGLKMVSESFKAHGYQVRYLGPNLSLEHSLIQINKFKPEVIGLSAALSYRLPGLKEIIKRFSELEWKPLIMIGGRMARKFALEELEADQVMIVKDLHHLSKWFEEGREGLINETS
ncbi:cobalamin-dependent protein [Halobacillus rhizosphaerae]|uniref:cobalamin B12-binding domain-containing protein n=1 Tax=Halobacillus rhizosphaerae TaxID=3064889 RepID=UPI00398B0A67